MQKATKQDKSEETGSVRTRVYTTEIKGLIFLNHDKGTKGKQADRATATQSNHCFIWSRSEEEEFYIKSRFSEIQFFQEEKKMNQKTQRRACGSVETEQERRPPGGAEELLQK